MTRKNYIVPLLCSFFATLTSAGLPVRQTPTSSCPEVRMTVERLPDLHTPRSGHHTFFINGELVVMGGHTDGFVPTPTAEYYHNGKWHQLSMVYPHDQGAAHLMKSGKTVILCGGHEQPLGIGQTFTLERYDTERHTFEGYGCLDLKRCFATCLELDSSRFVMTGNWYHSDGIELFDGARQNGHVKDVSQQRSVPYLLRTARNNAIIFSSIDIKGNPNDTIIIDRLHGDPFTIPLFERWRPFSCLIQPHYDDSFIGDEAQGRYAYLLTVTDSDGQVAIAKTDGETISLLPTAYTVPMKSRYGDITYCSYVIADRKAQRAYVMGYDKTQRLYVLTVEYAKEPALLTLYYSDPTGPIGYCSPVLTDDGNLLMAGGSYSNNFTPYATVLKVHLADDKSSPAIAPWICWSAALLALVIAAIFAYLIIYRRSRMQQKQYEALVADETADEVLMQRISFLMEEQQLYLNSYLKVADVAAKLSTNSAYISGCINHMQSCSFNQFVNSYRVAYAQRLLNERPDLKLSQICTLSGFATESSFFRNFKLATGMTPKEWKTEN